MRKLIFGIVTLIAISCVEKPKKEFSLKGTTNGMEEGTILYMENNNDLIDSTKIQNNSFTFNTKLPKAPFQVVLRTKNFSHYRFLWLENNPMTFNATQTDFSNAIVTGSNEENLSQTLKKETDSLSREESLIKNFEFVDKNPNSINSAYILSVFSTTWGKEQTKKLFDQFSTENKNSEYGKSIAKYIELNKNPKIGEKYVDFEMEDTNGKIRKLSDFNGKLVLLEFWASNCWPCRQENPNLVKTYETFNPKGFEIFSVSKDIEKEDWLKAIEKDKLPWLQVSDLKGSNNSASLIYGINGIPDNFLIDQNGIIVGRNLRGEKLNEKLSELLN
ncbi:MULTISPECIES: AhpC/TSA family protein [unclassified Tenacibaculum]|uniref:AhpC/TSA family protein n=1 Tax=unclassified Tenacibaculum TaxID=2635139 RepID=UPI001F1E780F|nr:MULTISPECIES: AhpC/TSA family protein [unclassified Tenacibaculum]MCF2876484.1 AhpC/TSA family protein [Tenacibaculum sp. Cn5-1]MCF2936609.1 AhpC/TSA family protein [Tenacibaculum sp. Cn5-34]MCG7511798.1 AhpC/TSA family protein [Tenacibaculum sp. Cn5-46]